MCLQGLTLVSLYKSFYFLFLCNVNFSVFKNTSFLAFELRSLLFLFGELIMEGRPRQVYFSPLIDGIPLQLVYDK